MIIYTNIKPLWFVDDWIFGQPGIKSTEKSDRRVASFFSSSFSLALNEINVYTWSYREFLTRLATQKTWVVMVAPLAERANLCWRWKSERKGKTRWKEKEKSPTFGPWSSYDFSSLCCVQ